MMKIRCVWSAVLFAMFAVMSGQSQTTYPLMADASIPKCGIPPGIDGELSDKSWKSSAAQHVTALRFTTAPTIDGDLSDACWATAPEQGEFFLFRSNAITTNTRFRVGHDGTWLYLAFSCDNPNPKQMKADTHERDAAVFGDESLEIYIAPENPAKTYFHIGLNCANIRVDRLCSAATFTQDAAWDPVWRSAVRLTDTGWNAELAFPLGVIAQYGAVKSMRLNIGRNKTIARRGDKGETAGYDKELSSWAPVEKGFNEVDRFGRLDGLTADALPFMPSLDAVEVSNLSWAEGVFYYDVIGELRNQSNRRGTVTLTASENTGLQAAIETVSPPIHMAGQAMQRAQIRVFTTPVLSRTLDVTLKDESGRDVFQTVSVETGRLIPLRACLDRNYYTSETQAQAICRVGLPANFLKGKTLRLTRGAETLAERGEFADTMILPFSLKDFPSGLKPTDVTVSVPGFTLNLNLVKLAPQPGREVKTDRENCGLLVNEHPFYLIGAAGASMPPELLAQAGAAGFNAVFNPHQKKTNMIELSCATAGQNGLMVLDDVVLYAHDSFRKTFIEAFGMKDEQARNAYAKEVIRDNFPDILAGVGKLKDQPALLAYNLSTPCHNMGFDIQAKPLRDAVAAADPYHPTFILFDHVLNAPQSAPALADIIAVDPFWDAGKTDFGPALNVATRAAELAASRRKPLWLCPYAWFYSGVHHQRYNWKPEDADRMGFLALISGARGLILSHGSSFTQQVGREAYLQSLFEMAGHLRALAPYAVAPALAQQCIYKDETRSGQVAFRLFRKAEGDYALAALNLTDNPVSVRVKPKGIGEVKGVTNFFDGSKARFRRGACEVKLKARGVSALAITTSGEAGNKAELLVE